MGDLFSDLFAEFFSDTGAFSQPAAVQETKKCPVCGHTWNDFRRTGRFGCARCYETFRPSVSATLRQIHSTTRHTGRVPAKAGGAISRRREYDALKQQLQQAVKNEDYEKAAALHKKIRAMEKEGI